MSFTASVIYQDPRSALQWLERAFGFETTMLVTDADDGVIVSEMKSGDGRLFVRGESLEWRKSPRAVGGANSNRTTVELDSDIDGHCERARAAGALITGEPADQPYGARTYQAVDLEGHEWDFSQAIEFSQEEMERAGIRVDPQLLPEPEPRAPFFPELFYKDPKALQLWLQNAFGFETSMVI